MADADDRPAPGQGPAGGTPSPFPAGMGPVGEIADPEALSRSIILHSPDCIKTLDLDGRLLFMSEGGRRILCIDDLSRYLGMPYESFWEGSDRQASLEAIVRARAGEVGHFRGYCPTEDGTPKWWDVIIGPIFGAEGQVQRLLAVSRDITQQKLAEDALRESEARYRLLVDCLHDGLWLLDREGRTSFANPRMAEMLGCSEDDLLGAEALSFVQEKDLALARERIALRRQGVAGSSHFEFLRRDGQTLFAHMNVTPLYDASGQYTGLLASVSDMTEQRRADEERERLLAQVIEDRQRIEALGARSQRQADELDAILQAIPDPVAVWDPDGVVLRANPAAAALGIKATGVPAAQVAVQRDVRYPGGRPVPPDELPVIRALRGETVRDHPEILLDADGQPREILASAAPVFAGSSVAAAVVLAHDVTEQRRTEEALRESEKKLRALFDLLPIGISVLDEQRRVVHENPALERILHLPREGLQAGTYAARRYLRPDGTSMPAAEFPSVRAARDGRPAEGQVGVVKEDGSLIWTDVRAVPVSLGDWRVVIATSDVTALKSAEAALLEANQELERRVEERTASLQEVNRRLRREIFDREAAEAELRLSEERLELRVAERTRELATLLEISNAVALSQELEPLLGLALDLMHDVVHHDGATVYRLEEGALVGLLHRGPVAVDEVRRLRLPVQPPSLPYDLLAAQTPVSIEDVRGDTPAAVAVRQAVGGAFDSLFGYVRAWLGIPLAVKGVVVGLLTLQRSEPVAFDEREIRLAQAFAGQMAVTLENARLNEQAHELAVLEERQHLARDLHDAVSQTLFSASLAAEVLPRLWKKDLEKGLECLAEVRGLTRGALAEMRSLLLELRPSSLVETEPAALLQQLSEAVSSRARIPVTVQAEPHCPLPPAVQVALYRVAQEALNNVAKHAGARQATVTLRCLAQEPSAGVELEVADDGCGFDPAGLPPGEARLGLGIMRERAEEVGASLELTSAPGAGTRVCFAWPAPAAVGRPPGRNDP